MSQPAPGGSDCDSVAALTADQPQLRDALDSLAVLEHVPLAEHYGRLAQVHDLLHSTLETQEPSAARAAS